MDSRRAFYSSELHTISYYQCYKKSGFDRIAVELYYENGVINTEDVQNYENALNAGLVSSLFYLLTGVNQWTGSSNSRRIT